MSVVDHEPLECDNKLPSDLWCTASDTYAESGLYMNGKMLTLTGSSNRCKLATVHLSRDERNLDRLQVLPVVIADAALKHVLSAGAVPHCFRAMGGDTHRAVCDFW